MRLKRTPRRGAGAMPPDAHEVAIALAEATLGGSLALPRAAPGIVVFAHGSGSSRFSPRNQAVAAALNEAGLATLLFDLLTAQENEIDLRTRELRFDIGLLSERLVAVIDWLGARGEVADLPIGLFGASTGAAAALKAAAARPQRVAAVVSRGGRPDLAGDDLPRVAAPTLLIVGGDDGIVIGLNREAAALLRCTHRVEIVPGATHLFEEPGKLERVQELARAWFEQYLRR